ncbi:MAG: hypothetical protein MET45_21575 [Nostoc sp. LLA-1]|nr:hypothetical protein [Cyanocohniella sp. LLY]
MKASALAHGNWVLGISAIKLLPVLRSLSCSLSLWVVFKITRLWRSLIL